jgi:hypothetical protein
MFVETLICFGSNWALLVLTLAVVVMFVLLNCLLRGDILFCVVVYNYSDLKSDRLSRLYGVVVYRALFSCL